MMLEWDEAKRLSNIEKHGIDFFDADLVFVGPLLVGQARTVDSEKRELAVGAPYDVFVTTVFERRGDTIRNISMRRARHEESKRYQKLLKSKS
jgi:uncharacterized DUF497 family protein